MLSSVRPVVCTRLIVGGGELDHSTGDRHTVHAHDHDYFEIFIVHEGSGMHVTADYQRELVPGTVGCTAPGEVHALDDCVGLTVTNVYYLAEWLLSGIVDLWDQEHVRALFLEPALFPAARSRTVPHFSLTPAELSAVERELADLSAENASTAPSILLLRSTLMKLMVHLARAYDRSLADDTRRTHAVPQSRRRDEVWALLVAVEHAIQRGNPLSVGQVAARYSITADHLSRLFHEATGTSPREYHGHRRIMTAASRLLAPGARVTDIALDLGFSDTAHLSRQFHTTLGVSPREYRRRYTVGSDGSTSLT